MHTLRRCCSATAREDSTTNTATVCQPARDTRTTGWPTSKGDGPEKLSLTTRPLMAETAATARFRGRGFSPFPCALALPHSYYRTLPDLPAVRAPQPSGTLRGRSRGLLPEALTGKAKGKAR